MAVRIAEYLGQKTDSDTPIIPSPIPIEGERHLSPRCPFNDNPCTKMKLERNANHPICSLRKSNGAYYIVCNNRLISTDVSKITSYQIEMLLRTAQSVFNPAILPHQIGYKSEVRIRTSDSNRGTHTADFVLAVVDPSLVTMGPRRLIVEVQGGGETNATGSITRLVEQWLVHENPSNMILSESSNAGTIETNAWRRLQEQLFAKATTAQKSGYGFAALIGGVIIDYIERMLPGLKSIAINPEDSGWNVAFIVFKEEKSKIPSQNYIELVVDKERCIYTTLELLFSEMAKRGQIDQNAFTGEFTTLTGIKVIV